MTEWMRPEDIKPNPDLFEEKLVTSWFVEIDRGERQVDGALVPMREVRPNPFAIGLNEAVVGSMLRDVTDLGPLLVARLPEGGYVDVDTPHACEAYRRAGVPLVDVQVVGTFTAEDCRRIGLPSAWNA